MAVPDRQTFRVRRVRWHSRDQPDGEPLAVLETDGRGYHPSAVASGFIPHCGPSEHLSATPDELDRWQAAGVAYLDAVAAAAAELSPVRRPGTEQWPRS